MLKKATVQMETISHSGVRKIRTGKGKCSVVLKEFLALLEDAAYDGRYRYAAVLVNGEVYREFEA